LATVLLDALRSQLSQLCVQRLVAQAMSSCPPENVITNYNQCVRLQTDMYEPLPLWSYLFWGAEYWLARQQLGDGSYLGAFTRVLEDSRTA
jgi:hypothetical protein